MATTGPDPIGPVQPSTDQDQVSEQDALASQTALALLERQLELARATEARLRVAKDQLARALEQAERELAHLSTLREEAEYGRRAHDAAIRLQVLEGSASWRVTRPLRLLSMAARRAAERRLPGR